jgi:ubiquinone/menaquinone biosynthesis C-methylase UbiE
MERCNKHMDFRVCGDIFHLPFADESIDGIWNVGVMEHFTHDQIDAIMTEFRRVIKSGHRIILLIPGADSPPQKILRAIEKVVNARSNESEFRFHPPEISQIQSKNQAMNMLQRNGFVPVHFNYGWRSLLAFKILVGVKQ